MILKDQISFPKPIIVPENLKSKLVVKTNCEISEHEVTLFNISIKATAKYIEDHHIDLSNYLTLNVYFTYNNQISISQEKESILGCQFCVATYQMEGLRKKPDGVILFVFIEELAHHFLRIIDERIIKQKVEEIYKYIVPDFTLKRYLEAYYND